MMSEVDHVSIGIETLRIDGGCSLDKVFKIDLYNFKNGMS